VIKEVDIIDLKTDVIIRDILLKLTVKKIILKMKSFKFFTHPDSSAAESSLSARREG
jgi:hypothetical protein